MMQSPTRKPYHSEHHRLQNVVHRFPNGRAIKRRRMSINGREAKRPPRDGLRAKLMLAFDRVPAERGVLFADYQRLLIVLAIVPSLQSIEAIPLLNRDALWRRAIECFDRLR